jgi:hypothetical protein
VFQQMMSEQAESLEQFGKGRVRHGSRTDGGQWLAVELRHDVLDAATTAGGAQKFPEAASRKISFSSVRSETAFRSRSFSFSSSFRRFTWSDFCPPNSLRYR